MDFKLTDGQEMLKKQSVNLLKSGRSQSRRGRSDRNLSERYL